MTVIVNRFTKEKKVIQFNRRTPDIEFIYPTSTWIYKPDLSAVGDFHWKYWLIDGSDNITLMDQAARDAVDAAELETDRDATSDRLDGVEALERAFALVTLDEINILRTEHSFSDRTISQMKTAVRNKLGT